MILPSFRSCATPIYWKGSAVRVSTKRSVRAAGHGLFTTRVTIWLKNLIVSINQNSVALAKNSKPILLIKIQKKQERMGG